MNTTRYPEKYDPCAGREENPGAGREVLERLNKVAAYAEMIADQVTRRLEPIVMQTPRNPDRGEVNPVRPQPPLFEAMSGQIARIESYLSVIETTMHKVDL